MKGMTLQPGDCSLQMT